jgi:hypothetical protein
MIIIFFLLLIHGLLVISIGVILKQDKRTLSRQLSPLLIGLGIQSCDAIISTVNRDIFEIILVATTFFNLFFCIQLIAELKAIIYGKND